MPVFSSILESAEDLFERFRVMNDQAHAAHDLDADADAEGEELNTGLVELEHEVLEFESLSVRGALVPGIKDWGVWAGARSLANPRRDVAFMRSIGVTTCHIILNDLSGKRAPCPYTIRNRARIVALANLCHANGIEVVLMSWILPHKAHIEAAFETLEPLMRDCKARMLCWDLEEPWTLGEACPVWGRRPHKKAGALIGELFKFVPMGMTGIRYAPVAKLRPVAVHCLKKYVQSYSTSSSGASPLTVVDKGMRKWTKDYGSGVVSALAGYRQKGIKKDKRRVYTVREALLATFAAAAKHGDEVCIWVLDTIRFSPEIAHAFADASGASSNV